MQCWIQFFGAPIFFQGFAFSFQLCILGEGGAWRHLGGLGRLNHVYRIIVQGFGKKCWRWRFQSFIRLLLCCLSACGVTLAKIFIFFLESGPYVYVQRASDRRSLLNGWRVPELRQCKTAFKAMSVSSVSTNRLVRQYCTSGVKPAPEGQSLRIAVRVGSGWNTC